jgi:hypothetical protein
MLEALLAVVLTATSSLATTLPTPPVAATGCWRPTIDDVDRISWGRNAKKKGTGSRGVPHRLNDDERSLYDIARRKGFVEIGGSGWRRQRSDAPLVNTYRSWCDAREQPAVYLHKGPDGNDEVVADLSPLRTPSTFAEAADYCRISTEALDGVVEFESLAGAEDGEEGDADGLLDLAALGDAYRDEPIYRVPMYAVVWRRPRAEAKALAKALSERLGTAAAVESAAKGRAKARGAPRVKPGRSRKSGGYGIG